MEVKLSDFDYELPQELIAQMPADKRQNSKMLVLDKTNNTILLICFELGSKHVDMKSFTQSK